MKFLLWILPCIISLSFSSHAQNLKSFQRSMEKQDFEKAAKQVFKILESDSNNAIGLYASSLLYFDSLNIKVNFDTSYAFAVKAMVYKDSLNEDQIDDLSKTGHTLDHIIVHKAMMDSLAYINTTKLHTEDAYLDFLRRYPTAIQVSDAEKLRNALAFAEASREDTWNSYLTFIEKYPQATEAEVAIDKYHLLIYHDKTDKGTIEQYALFITDHPENPFRPEAEEQLYKMVTNDHLLASYENFIIKYHYHNDLIKAWKWVYYLSGDSLFKINHPESPIQDFITQQEKVHKLVCFPFIENGKFGLMSAQKEILIPPTYQGISDDFNCSAFKEDMLVFGSKGAFGAVNKLGELLTPFSFDYVEPFSSGILLIEKNSQYGLWSYLNEEVFPLQYNDIQVANKSLIIAQKGKHWGVYNYHHEILEPSICDEIKVLHDSIFLLRKNNLYKYQLSSEYLDTSSPNRIFQYDSIVVTHDQYLHIWFKNNEGIIDLAGKPIVPFDQHEIIEVSHGWKVEKLNRTEYYNQSGVRIGDQFFDNVIASKQACAVKKNDFWGVYAISGDSLLGFEYDSVMFIENEGLLLKKGRETYSYFFNQDSLINMSGYTFEAFEIIKTDSIVDGKVIDSKKDIYYITVDRQKRKGLEKSDGQKVLFNRYTDISFLTDEYVLMEYNGKKGLYNLNGTRILPASYNGIMYNEKGFFSVLQNKRFGLVYPDSGIITKVIYESVPKFYGYSDTLFVATKYNASGIIDWKGNNYGDFMFDQVRYWNDSTALVQHENKWKLYQFKKQYFIPEVFDTFEYDVYNKDEVRIITFSSSGYGMLSNKNGRMVPEEYTNIYSLGTKKEKVYLLEKYNALSDSYLATYLSFTGDILRESYLNGEDFEALDCD